MHLMTILRSLMDSEPCTIIYRDSDGVVSLRTIRPLAVRHCRNGNTIVSAFDVQRDAPRSFTATRVLDAVRGSLA
jgi:predicted DNA-binding transcriptional regulator YafY